MGIEWRGPAIALAVVIGLGVATVGVAVHPKLVLTAALVSGVVGLTVLAVVRSETGKLAARVVLSLRAILLASPLVYLVLGLSN